MAGEASAVCRRRTPDELASKGRWFSELDRDSWLRHDLRDSDHAVDRQVILAFFSTGRCSGSYPPPEPWTFSLRPGRFVFLQVIGAGWPRRLSRYFHWNIA